MKLTRTLARVFCVSLLFLGSASRAQAAFWDLFFNNTSVEENVDDTIDAVTQSETEGIPSHESFVDNNLLNVQTSSLIFVAGPPESAAFVEEAAPDIRQLDERSVPRVDPAGVHRQGFRGDGRVSTAYVSMPF